MLVLTARQLEVLQRLRDLDVWARPMDVGGTDCSHHSRTLRQLVAKGLVERAQRRGLRGYLDNYIRGAYEYRLTERGRRQRAVVSRRRSGEC